MLLASSYNCKSLAFSSIGTGKNGFSQSLAAQIAVSEVLSFSGLGVSLEKVLFLPSDEYDNYYIERELKEVLE